MMTARDYEYIQRLKRAYNALAGKYERAVFWYICKAFQNYKYNSRGSKHVSKEELLRFLVREGFHILKSDGSLPDERKLRDTVRGLLYRGLPVVATSKAEGYYIAECGEEIDAPQAENNNRGKKILMANRGYERARQFIVGQTSIFDTEEL